MKERIEPIFEIIDIEAEVKSTVKIGNLCFNISKKFNWFNRKMIKLIFGFDVENREIK